MTTEKDTRRAALSWVALAASVVIMLLAGNHALKLDQQFGAADARKRMLVDLIDTSTSGVCVTDADGYILEWNARMTAMFGWSRAEAIGEHVTFLMTPELRDRHQQAMDAAKDSRPVMGTRMLTCWVVGRRGNLIHAHISIRTSETSGGERFYAILFDLPGDVKELGDFPLPDESDRPKAPPPPPEHKPEQQRGK